jgi:hypothetical protein
MIAKMSAQHGMEPAPERERKTNWKELLRQHWDLTAAADFFTIEAWTRRGYSGLSSCFSWNCRPARWRLLGSGSSPSGLWMNQIGRNLTDAVDGLLNGKRYLP